MIRQPTESNDHRLERLTRTLFAGGLALALVPSIVFAFTQDEQPGYQPRLPYDSGSLVDVNLYNLNLVVRLPFSHTYPVNENVSYGLTAYYNGAFQWENNGTISSYGGKPNAIDLHGWLGAGWRMDFGKVMNGTFPHPPSSSCSLVASTWVSPGGAHHPFTSSNLGATQDGTDVRVSQVGYPWSQNCPVPTRVTDRLRKWDFVLDASTGRVVQIEAAYGISSHHVDVSYMGPADFLAVDPNADPESWNYDSPAPLAAERTFAIKNVSDTHGRLIETTMGPVQLEPGRSKFLLQSLNVPVFGDDPDAPTGVYTLHYEVRDVDTEPPDWPPFAEGIVTGAHPYLVRVELPADQGGNRLSYVFDYNEHGEMVEIRTPERVNENETGSVRI